MGVARDMLRAFCLDLLMPFRAVVSPLSVAMWASRETCCGHFARLLMPPVALCHHRDGLKSGARQLRQFIDLLATRSFGTKPGLVLWNKPHFPPVA